MVRFSFCLILDPLFRRPSSSRRLYLGLTAQVTARCDGANDPRGRKETIYTIQELRPGLTQNQLATRWDD